MSKRDQFVLIAVGVIIAVVAGVGISTPGYMDAEYYYLTGVEIGQGRGFWEPVIWNYLNNPLRIPNPSHGYWMPLTSMFVAIPTFLVGSSFRTAQMPFILLFAALPWLTAWYSFSLNHDREAAFQSGLLAALPGFFLPYFITTDMFILYAWIGTLFFWTSHQAAETRSALLWIVSGMLIGLAHLARADGLLFVLPFLYFTTRQRGSFPKRVLLGLSGYLLIMMPWFVRNLTVYGSVSPPGTQSALWLRSYQDLFRFPASELGPDFLIQAGWSQLVEIRLTALWTNAQRLIAENGLVFLLPFFAIGIWEKWHLDVVRAAILFWAGLILVMSFIFPFAGAQGGTFHSSAALMPTLWLLVPFGLRTTVEWVGLRRSWNVQRATSNFAWIFIVLAGVFTLAVYTQRVYGIESQMKRWSADSIVYQEVGEYLTKQDSHPGVVAVNNPPGFYVATGIPAVVVPSGGEEALHQVVGKYQVEYVILDRNHPTDLGAIYRRERSKDWLSLIEVIDAGYAAPILIFETSSGQDES